MQTVLNIHEEALPSHTTGFLEIDTQAILKNYRTLESLMPKTMCAAVLKADAYGFGLKTMAPLLAKEGCPSFFVAHLEEALLLRTLVKNTPIYVLSGFLPDAAELFIEHTLTPVLNDFGMLKCWVKEAQKRGEKLPSVLHIDTGMNRCGFDQQDLSCLLESFGLLGSLEIECVMSHLVSSHDPLDPLNHHQRQTFENLRQHFPQTKASLADTGGIYLGSAFHYDIARPGKGLFGLFTPPNEKSSLQPCLKFFARILQIRSGKKGETVGYGATHTLARDSTLATLGVGFADGYDRRLSNKATVNIQGLKAPVVGRISMDYTVVDVTDIPESLCFVGGWAELVNEALTLDVLAKWTGGISRELSTGFSPRLMRVYR